MATGKLVLAVSTAAALVALPAAAQQVEGPEVSWNISTWGKEREFTAGIEKIADLVSERTGGNFQIKIHYGEALSGSRENLDGLKLGAFEGAMFCSFYHPGKTPAWEVISMPFLPLGDWEVNRKVREAMLEHPILVADMERWNAMPYFSALLPQYEFLGRGDPPETLEDWNGLRVRAGGGIGDAMEKLGAILTTVPAPEVYTGLERGTMDAASFPYTYSHAAYQIPEVTDWFTSNMSPGTTECGTVLSKTAYEELPDQYQQLLEDVKDEAYEVQVQAYQDIDKVNLPKFREQLTEVTYSDEVLQEFRAKAGQAVWEEWIEANKDLFDSQQLFDDLVAEIEKAGATVQ